MVIKLMNFNKHSREIYYDPDYLSKVPDNIKNNIRFGEKIEQIKNILELTDFRETPDQSIFQQAKNIHKSPLWYPREKVLRWYLWQTSKLYMWTGLSIFSHGFVDGG